MREKLLSLPLTELKALAKAGGVKGITGLKKEELVDLLIEVDAKRRQEAAIANEKSRKEAGKATRVNSIAEADRERSKDKERAKEKPHTNKEHGDKDASKDGRHVKEGAKSPEEGGTIVYRADKPSKNANFEELKDAKASVVSESGSEKYAEGKPEPEQAAPSARPAASMDTYVPQEGDTLVEGILEVMTDGFGFIRSANYLPGDNDVYVSPQQIRGFRLRTGDVLTGIKRAKGEKEKFSPLSFLERVNGRPAKEALKRVSFENLTPIFPDKRIKLETPGCKVAMRAMDLVSPVGYGQRGMIVSPPKAGKTTLLKEIAHSMLKNDPETHMIILLIDERPEEVTDIKEAIIGKNVEVIYSTFDEQPEHHIRVAEMVIERARRLVEQKEDVVILLDSITRLTRAYNQVIPPSGRTLSGGLDPAALHMPKRFFGAARNMREGGSLTVLATALVETGSKMDDVVYEEFKGTGNMEIVLDRKLSEKRIFPAIDLAKSGTRREDLLLGEDELEAINVMRKALNGLKPDEATDRILDLFSKSRNNVDFVRMVRSNKFL
ncbi:MAG: transcription termination factor Rho [Lachnospiraceae bacterium]|nr:transcription termination factor Rho [Lachnospiraceae bacterium]